MNQIIPTGDTKVTTAVKKEIIYVLPNTEEKIIDWNGFAERVKKEMGKIAYYLMVDLEYMQYQE